MFLSRIKYLLADIGFERRQGNSLFTASYKVLTETLAQVYGRFALVEFDLSVPLPPTRCKVADLVIRTATPDDLPLLKPLVRPSRFAEFVRDLERGDTCFIALHQGKVVHFVWARGRQVPFLKRLGISLAPEEVYMTGAYTVPQMRGRGIHTAVWNYRVQYLKKMGYQRSVALVKIGNKAPRHVCKKMGGREVRYLGHLRVGNRELVWNIAPSRVPPPP